MTKKLTLRQMTELEEEYMLTHGGERPAAILKGRAADPRKPLVEMGKLLVVGYVSDKGNGEILWMHDFENDLPILAYDPKSKLLVISGGSYTITDRGIEG